MTADSRDRPGEDGEDAPEHANGHRNPALSMEAALAAELNALSREGLQSSFRVIERKADCRVVVGGREAIDFSSNDYLGLAADIRLAAALASALLDVPTGAGAPRLVSGNHPLHALLEHELAQFKRTEAALVFGTGYLASIGCIPVLVGAGDAVYCDELNHSSVVDAVRLSGAELRVFPHRGIEELNAMLRADAGKYGRRLIAVDAVFGMEGDLFPLDRLVELAREHAAWTYVDDAHATGVLGRTGRGALEHFGVEGEIDLVMGALSKGLGTFGAFVCGRKVVIDYLMNRSHAFISSTSSPPALAAAALEALHIAETDTRRRVRLHENAKRLWARLSRVVPSERLNTGPQTVKHIVPVMIGEPSRTRLLGDRLLERGFLVGAIRPPLVPRESARLRITVSALHTEADIDDLARATGEELERLSA
jgi:8-amino-7-oxononanoate synthase